MAERKESGVAVTLSRRGMGARSGRGGSGSGVARSGGSAAPTFVWEPEARARSVARATRAKIRRASHLRSAGMFQGRQERLEAVMAAITAVQSTIALGIVAPSSDNSTRLWGITIAGWVGILTFATNTAIAGLRALDMHFNHRRNVQQHMDAAGELSHFITGVYSLLVPDAPLTMPSRATEKDHENVLRRIVRASVRIFPDQVRTEVREHMAAFLAATRHITQEGGSIVSLASEGSPATRSLHDATASPATRPERGPASPASTATVGPAPAGGAAAPRTPGAGSDSDEIFVDVEAKDA